MSYCCTYVSSHSRFECNFCFTNTYTTTIKITISLFLAADVVDGWITFAVTSSRIDAASSLHTQHQLTKNLTGSLLMKSIVPARIQKVFMLSTLFSLYYYYTSLLFIVLNMVVALCIWIGRAWREMLKVQPPDFDCKMWKGHDHFVILLFISSDFESHNETMKTIFNINFS